MPPCSLAYILSVAAFELQWQSWVVAIEKIWPAKAKIVLSGLLQKKLAEPWTGPVTLILIGGELRHKKRKWPEITVSQWLKEFFGSLLVSLSVYYHIKADKQKFLGLSCQRTFGPLIYLLSAHSHTQALSRFLAWAAASVTSRGQHWLR